ncbi:MAG: autotransporter-associated beta strand repeat-containing protein, partial [Tepidisphaeraceae bacterium]
MFSRQASAQVTGTWTEGDTGEGELWTDSLNWSGGIIPGDNTGITTNTDTAVFNNSPSSNVVNLGASSYNLQKIFFDTAAADNFAIGATANTGSSLLLTGGTGAESASQSITVNSTVDNGSDEIINAPIVLEGNSYAFVDLSTTSTAGLQISGYVSGGASGTTNLYLDGANSATLTSGNSSVIGDISNGSATTLNLVKNGTGEWELRTTDTNTYNGSTTVNDGTLRVTTTGGLPSTTNVTVNGATDGTALLRLSATTFPTINSLTLLNGNNTLVQVSQSGGCGVNIDGTGFTWNASGITATVPDFKFQLDLTGSSANNGFTLINGPLTPVQKYGGTGAYGLDLGTVSHIFNIDQGGQSIPSQSFNSSDLILEGMITSDSSGGGITKTGAGVLKLQNPGNNLPEQFTGPIAVQQGTLRLIGVDLTNPLNGNNPLTIDGGVLDINAANASFGAATFTSGSLISSTVTNSSSEIFAPSYMFTLASGVTFTADAGFGDYSAGVVHVGTAASGTSALSVTGPGTLVMNGIGSNYSGGTTVTSGGTLVAANPSGSATGTGNVTLTGSILASKTSGAISGSVSADATSTIAPGGIGTVGTLSVGGLTTVSGSTLSFELGTGTSPITNGSLLILGTVGTTIGSGTVMSFGGTSTIGDDYRLIGDTSSGSVVDAIPLSHFTFASVPGGESYSLSTTVDTGYIDLVVVASGPPNLTWNNTGGSSPDDGQTWDISHSNNWNNSSAATMYTDGALVTFNDTNNGNYAVTLSTTVSPGSVTVNNSSGNYTISGSGSIAGTTSLTKLGIGTLA